MLAGAKNEVRSWEFVREYKYAILLDKVLLRYHQSDILASSP